MSNVMIRPGAIVEVPIRALGHGGDGLAEAGGARLYVPYTVAGDVVRVRVDGPKGDGFAAAVIARIADGPERVAPPCRHFGVCGGCDLQQLSPAAHDAHLVGVVRAALARRGLDETVVGAPRQVPPESRRRVRFAAHRHGGAVTIGFRRRASRRIVAIAECPVSRPAIVALVPQLRAALADILPDGGEVEVTVVALPDGLDVLIHAGRTADLMARERLAHFAEAADLARLAWQADGPAEPIAVRHRVQATLSGVAVELPPGAFLQPTREGEALLTGAVLDGLGGAGRVADLFAGLGPFAFALAGAGARVAAFESDPAMSAAAAAAARRAGLGMLSFATRDLERRPLSADELAGFDAAVLDPPRPGARRQSVELAASRLSRLVYVSCNPASFARDARLLVDGGFRLAAVTPIDQFRWSAHVELVAVFAR